MDCNSYEIDLKLDPKGQFMESKVKLTYYFTKDHSNEINFYIHKNMDIKQVNCIGMDKFSVSKGIVDWSPFVLESKEIKIALNRHFSKGEKLEVYFEYSGHLNIVTEYGINRLTENWIELGMYTPWFPLLEGLDPSIFNVDVEIDSEYTVIGAHNVQNANSKWSLRQDSPEADCTIIASDKFNRIHKKVNDMNMSVYYIEDSYSEVANKIDEISVWLLESYKNTFGTIHTSDYSIVIAPNRSGGGYCRKRLTVISSDESMKSQSIEAEIKTFRFIAHELAHLWWIKADFNTWEDWLNESFAEYSSLLMLRDRYGEDKFLTLINSYEEKSKNLPAIKDLDRGHEKAFEVLYIKGPVLLNKLETRVGKQQFKNFLQKIHTDKIDTTSKFLDKLADFAGKDIADDFLERLKG